jgi:hypothetical protein
VGGTGFVDSIVDGQMRGQLGGSAHGTEPSCPEGGLRDTAHHASFGATRIELTDHA